MKFRNSRRGELRSPAGVHRTPLRIGNKILAAVLVFVMVFGVPAFVAPESVTLTAHAVSFDDNGGTTFQSGDEIKVVNMMRTSKNEAIFTYGENNEWTTNDPFVWNGESKNAFVAWYPLTASYNNFTIPTDQSSGQLLAAADWMTASSGEIDKPENHTLNLNFQHRLAKVTVNITEWNDEFGGVAQEVLLPKIYSKGTALTATYDDSSVTIATTGDDIGINPLVSSTSYTAIVAPVKYAATDKFMTFTVDGQEMTVLARPSSLTDGLEAGKHYTFNLSIGKDAVTLSSVSVADWADGGTIDGGVAKEIKLETFTNGTAADITVYKSATYDDINPAVTNALNEGCTTLNISLPYGAEAPMFAAIRDALSNSEVQNITLTVSGAAEIPQDFLGRYADTENNRIVEAVTNVRAVNLPDATSIGSSAFSGCSGLTSVTAPYVQTVDMYAFAGTGITEISLPKAIALGYCAFSGCTELTKAILPSATSLGELLFNYCPKLTSLELTTADDIAFGNNCFNGDEGNVKLTLNTNKQSAVSGTTFGGYTFTEITFVQ